MKDNELRDLFRELLNYTGKRLTEVEGNIIERVVGSCAKAKYDEQAHVREQELQKHLERIKQESIIPFPIIGMITGALLFAAGMLTVWLMK